MHELEGSYWRDQGSHLGTWWIGISSHILALLTSAAHHKYHFDIPQFKLLEAPTSAH